LNLDWSWLADTSLFQGIYDRLWKLHFLHSKWQRYVLYAVCNRRYVLHSATQINSQTQYVSHHLHSDFNDHIYHPLPFFIQHKTLNGRGAAPFTAPLLRRQYVICWLHQMKTVKNMFRRCSLPVPEWYYYNRFMTIIQDNLH